MLFAESWSLRGGSELRWEEWPDGVTVYHPPSGETHFLNDVSGEIFHLLREAPMDVESLVGKMADGLPAEDFVKLSSQTRALLLRLSELGLAERRGAKQQDG